MFLIRTYCLIGKKYFGVWLRLAHWRHFLLWQDWKHFTFQVGPLNVRIGENIYFI